MMDIVPYGRDVPFSQESNVGVLTNNNNQLLNQLVIVIWLLAE